MVLVADRQRCRSVAESTRHPDPWLLREYYFWVERGFCTSIVPARFSCCPGAIPWLATLLLSGFLVFGLLRTTAAADYVVSLLACVGSCDNTRPFGDWDLPAVLPDSPIDELWRG